VLSRRPILRSVLAVAAGELSRLVLLAVFVIAVLMPAYSAAGWKEGAPVPDTPRTRTALLYFLLWILVVVNPAGGFVCAMLGRRAYLAHGAALSVLAVAVYAHEVITTPPGAGPPAFFVAGTFAANVVGITLGAYLYSRRAARQREPHRTADSAH
jgi:hypothetical protein